MSEKPSYIGREIGAIEQGDPETRVSISRPLMDVYVALVDIEYIQKHMCSECGLGCGFEIDERSWSITLVTYANFEDGVMHGPCSEFIEYQKKEQ